MRSAFEAEKPEEAWERDYYTMAAAQWILWHGQTLFKLIIYNDIGESSYSINPWRFGKTLVDLRMQPCSVERWRSWKARFKGLESYIDASNECKKVASRAAVIMGSMEQSMLF